MAHFLATCRNKRALMSRCAFVQSFPQQSDLFKPHPETSLTCAKNGKMVFARKKPLEQTNKWRSEQQERHTHTHTQVFRHIYFQVYTSNVSLLCQHHTSGCVLINTISWVFEEVDKTRHKNIWYWLTFSVFRWCISVLQLTQKTCGHKQPWVIVCLNVCAGKQLRLVLILLKLFDSILWPLLVRGWGGNKCRLLIREKKKQHLAVETDFRVFSFWLFSHFLEFYDSQTSQ